MPLAQSIAYLLAGACFLWLAGDWLVEAALRVTRRLGMAPALAGVLILGFGTSFPELVVTCLAAWKGNADIAASNVVGSNITNVALILGVSALIARVPVDRFLLRVEIPIGIAASLLCYLLMRDEYVNLRDGMILLGAFVAYLIFAVRTAHKRDVPESEGELAGTLLRDICLVVACLALVVASGHFFLEGAKDVARRLGLSEAAIGGSLVALGTSLPELATGVAAARKGQLDMALGNVIGSNIFNVLLVLGCAASLSTQHVDQLLPAVLLPAMIALACVPWIAGWIKGHIGRYVGMLLVASYAVYLVYLTTAGSTGA